jgi:hypothetical protein
LLVLAKFFGGIWSIVVSEVLYRMMNKTLCFQFRDAFQAHFSPHYFGVIIKRGCEAMVHDIQAALDVHLDSMLLRVNIANAFNIISLE